MEHHKMQENARFSNHTSSEEHEGVVGVQGGYQGQTPPPGQLPPRGQRIWVDRPEELLEAVKRLAQAPVVAIDAEFTQTRSHTQSEASGPRLALLQLAIEGECFVVDALRLWDLEPLAP